MKKKSKGKMNFIKDTEKKTIKLNNYQKLVLNMLGADLFDISFLLCFLFGINYIKQLLIFISPAYHYWVTIFWGVGLIFLGIIFLIKANKFKKRIKELTKK